MNKIETAIQYLQHIIKNTKWENKIFLAGGAVRDTLLNISPKDIDIVVIGDGSAGIDFSIWATKLMRNFKENSNPVVYPKFFTSKFTLKNVIYNGTDLSDVEIEAVSPRSEEYEVGSRKPEVSASTLSADAFRRDTTFNSLFKNISTGEILDYTGSGIKDLKAGIIRTPIDPDKTFKDDALRMMRVIRFFAKYNYKIPLYIIKSIKKNASFINTISSERIQDELNKILITTNVKNAFRLLKLTGLLEHVIPEFKTAYKMTQNKYHFATVWDHSLDVLSKTKPELLNRLTGLFHDIGKTTTREVIDGEVHFYAHEQVGSEIVNRILTRLKYPTHIINAVVTGVKQHMRLKGAGKEGEVISDKALRKFTVELGDHLELMYDVMAADNAAHSEGNTNPNQIPGVIKRINALKSSTPKAGDKLPVSGDDLIKLGLKPGPLFTKLLDLVKDRQLEFPNTTKEEYLNIIKTHLQSLKSDK